MSVDVPMTESAEREEIAFIRRAIEEGRGYATGWSGDMMVWGVLMRDHRGTGLHGASE